VPSQLGQAQHHFDEYKISRTIALAGRGGGFVMVCAAAARKIEKGKLDLKR
jgi:hypothetical protein